MRRACLFVSAAVIVFGVGCSSGPVPTSPSRAVVEPAAIQTTSSSSALFGGSSVDFARCLEGVGDSGCFSAGARTQTRAVGATATAPGPPLNLSGSSSGSTVTLTWSAPIAGDPVVTYYIEAGSRTGLADLANFATFSTATRFSATGIGAGTYYVRIRAVNAAGVSVVSNEWILIVGGTFCTAPPGAPSGLILTPTGSTVAVAWSAPASAGCPATSYFLQAGSSPGLSNLANSNVGNTTSYVATGVGNGTYYVRVRAANAYGQSAPSSEITLDVGSTQTPTPTTVDISPTVINLGAAGGCPGAVLSATIAVTAPAATTWTVGVSGSLAPPGVVGGATLDRSSGTGSGSVKLTVVLNPQTPFPTFTCADTNSLPFSDTVFFLFSPGGFLSSRVTYTYVSVK